MSWAKHRPDLQQISRFFTSAAKLLWIWAEANLSHSRHQVSHPSFHPEFLTQDYRMSIGETTQ